MRLWNKCLVMKNFLVVILVIVHNGPIGFLDSGATGPMTPQISCFISGLLEDTYKYIKFADGHYVTAKQIGNI